MVQIGPIKYNKDEEAILTRSILLATFVGFPLSLLLSYWFNLLTNPRLAPSDSFGWAAFYFRIGSVVMVTCWGITVVTSLSFYKKRRKLNSKRNIGRIIFASLLVPMTLTYMFLFLGFIFVPLSAFLIPYLDPIAIWGIGALVFFPFLILFIAIVGPDSKPRKILNRSFRRLKRKMRKLH